MSLGDIEPGDEVAIDHGGRTYRLTPATVDRVTDTQVIVGSTRYRKKDGWEVGNRYGARLLPWTDKTARLIERHQALADLQRATAGVDRPHEMGDPRRYVETAKALLAAAERWAELNPGDGVIS